MSVRMDPPGAALPLLGGESMSGCPVSVPGGQWHAGQSGTSGTLEKRER